jgi:predicted glycosyltransferase involved in capsule biosynthesis
MELPVFSPAPPIFEQKVQDVPLDPREPIGASDISMVLCVRWHEANPWVIDRIALMGEFYAPAPKIIIVDFGSHAPHSANIRAVCEGRGYTYVHVDDTGIFSLSAARNAGFAAANTPFIYFADPDFFSERGHFGKLADIINTIEATKVFDLVLNVPAFHLSEPKTEAFFDLDDFDERSNYLKKLSFYGYFENFEPKAGQFIAPYSNVFLIGSKLFSYLGGYDSSFRGHGSEDFEFLLRYGQHAKHLPMPSEPTEDCFGPGKSSFFQPKTYSGFRRLFEALALPAESFGLKTFHLWHPKDTGSDWYKNNDWKRSRFSEATAVYVGKDERLLEVDFLPRAKKLACICKNRDHWGYFIPLRLAGFELVPFFRETDEDIAALTDGLTDGTFAGIAIFNPYMKSHSRFADAVTLARQLDRDVVVIERGALPNTVYYADDVSYAASSYSQEAFDWEIFSAAELGAAQAYIQRLREGSMTLEAMDSFASTAEKYQETKQPGNPICLIPLQLDDDMAVTKFLKGEQSYHDFAASLSRLVENNPDMTFVIKPHPLSKLDALPRTENVVIADRADNIHFLIDHADVVLCYNSGVGLLSLLHGKPTITLGNAFYNLSGAGFHATSAEEGISSFKSGAVHAPNEALVQRIAAWFVLRKYSEFIATDHIVEFESRKAHGYKDIMITMLRWKEHEIGLGRLRQLAPFGKKSYLAARAGVIRPLPIKKTKKISSLRRPLVPIVRFFIGRFGSSSAQRKFDAGPVEFFQSLRKPTYRAIGKILFPG